jgi:hypothetical protein
MDEGFVHRLAWLIANILSLILLICLLFIWFKAYHHIDVAHTNRIKTLAQAQHYLQNTWEKKYRLDKPIYISTGIFVQHLSFKTANDLNVMLLIWQHFPNNFPADIQRSFSISDQVETNDTTNFMLYKQSVGNEELIGTLVDTQINQHFNYKKYPFDNQTINISIWPHGYNKNVILIPDFAAYDHEDDLDVPMGLRPNIIVRDFIIKDTYFGYKTSHYDTNFGQTTSIDQYGYPYFYFAVVLKRALFSAVVIHVLPLIIAFILLFVILMMSTEKKYKLAKFSFTGNMLIVNCSALFFVLVVIHIGLRARLFSDQVIYLEYFYFLIYILIAVVVLNNYILLSDTKKKIKFIHYADNLIPKVLYWPCILVIAFILSVKILL